MASLLQEEDSDEERLTLKNQPSKWMLLMVALAGLSGFIFGYDIGVISGAMILLKEDYNLVVGWQTALVSSTIASAGVFALIAGVMNRRFGRRPVIIAASFLACLGAILAASSATRSVLMAGRIIMGVGIGERIARRGHADPSLSLGKT